MKNTQAAPICMCVDSRSRNLFFKKGTARKAIMTIPRSVVYMQSIHAVFSWCNLAFMHIKRYSCTPAWSVLIASKDKGTLYNHEMVHFVKELWLLFTPTSTMRHTAYGWWYSSAHLQYFHHTQGGTLVLSRSLLYFIIPSCVHLFTVIGDSSKCVSFLVPLAPFYSFEHKWGFDPATEATG